MIFVNAKYVLDMRYDIYYMYLLSDITHVNYHQYIMYVNSLLLYIIRTC